MKAINIFPFLIIIILFSCGRNKYEKKLVGNWYSYSENEKFVLDKDTLSADYLHQKVKWFSTKDSLKFNYKGIFNDSIYKVSLKYILNNDTLLITPNNSSNTEIKFVRANKFLDFLFSKYKVNINLPVNYNVENIEANTKYGIKVFLEINNDSIISKTQYSKNLMNLNRDLEKHLSFFSTDIDRFKKDYGNIYKDLSDKKIENLWIKFNVHFSIFADKKITIKELRFFYNRLKSIKEISKIYRVYDINESEFVDFYKLKGVEL